MSAATAAGCLLAFDANDNAKWRVGRALDARSEKKAELASADREEPTDA